MLRPSALVALLLLAATPARAQSSSDQAAAEALFESGKKLLAEGKTAQACPKLEESLRIETTGPTLFLLADCLEKDGRSASAWARWKEAADLAKKRGKADKEQEALAHVKAVSPLVPRVRINVPPSLAATTGLEITRNGLPVGPGVWGVELPVDPGEITVEARAPGKTPWKLTRPLTQGQTLTFEILPLAPAQQATPAPSQTASAPPPPPGDPGTTQRAIGYSIGGLGLVGVALGAVFFSSAVSKNSDITARDGRGECVNGACQGLVDERNGKATIGYIGFIGGGAALMGGLVLVLTAPSKLTYVLAPTPQGLLLRGSF